MPWRKSWQPATEKGPRSRRQQTKGRRERENMRQDGKQTERTSEVAIVAWSLALFHLEAPKKACHVRCTCGAILIKSADRKNNQNRGYSGFSAGSGSRAERVKNEDDSYGGSGHRSGGGGGGGGASTKREDGGLVSSDEEDSEDLPRKNIDRLDLSSDELGDAPSPHALRGELPVRIGRKEHQERKVGINTEASTDTLVKVPEEEESARPPLKAANLEQTTRKSKSKSRDVEITGSRKPWKGVWHDPDDSDVVVKTEVASDDENMPDAEQTGLSHTPVQPSEKQEAILPDVERKQELKKKGPAEPILQTDEDRAEWERLQSHRRHMLAELGPAETPEVDGSGDTAMTDAAGPEKKPTVRENNVYLFQIPPLMPEVESSIKKEAPEPKADAKIKLEEGGFSDPSAKPKGVRFESGRVGKLRVHKSGRTTLDWGGISFEVTAPGTKVGLLQEAASVEITPENQRSAPEDAGDTTSLGRVKGKFVVTPDLTKMLG